MLGVGVQCAILMVNLYVSFYIDKSAARQREIETCLQRNIDNPLIDKIYLINNFEECPIKSDKIHEINQERRVSFNDFFGYINIFSKEHDVNIIANSDIFFDNTLKYLNRLLHNHCFALTRWDAKPERTVLFNHSDSQDAWIVRGKVKNIFADFCLGIPGTDNRIAYEFSQAGYKVTNPCKTIKAYHLHNTGVRNYGKDTARVDPPYLQVPISA